MIDFPNDFTEQPPTDAYATVEQANAFIAGSMNRGFDDDGLNYPQNPSHDFAIGLDSRYDELCEKARSILERLGNPKDWSAIIEECVPAGPRELL